MLTAICAIDYAPAPFDLQSIRETAIGGSELSPLEGALVVQPLRRQHPAPLIYARCRRVRADAPPTKRRPAVSVSAAAARLSASGG